MTPVEIIRVAVVDDDDTERERLVRHLRAEPDLEIVGILSGGRRAVPILKRLAPDVVFLDVHLRELDGFEVLRSMNGAGPSNVVFVTAAGEHAARAFDMGAVDYLLKPIEGPRVGQAVARVRAVLRRERATQLLSSLERLLHRQAPDAHDAQAPSLERFLVHDRERSYFLKTSEVDWIEAADNYVRVHTGGTTHLIRQTLTQFHAKLDPTRFVRIHRSTVVNLDRVREIQPGVGRDRLVVLECGTQLRMSERYRVNLDHLSRRT
jgi:two-component system LytT family response regulator